MIPDNLGLERVYIILWLMAKSPPLRVVRVGTTKNLKQKPGRNVLTGYFTGSYFANVSYLQDYQPKEWCPPQWAGLFCIN